MIGKHKKIAATGPTVIFLASNYKLSKTEKKISPIINLLFLISKADIWQRVVLSAVKSMCKIVAQLIQPIS